MVGAHALLYVDGIIINHSTKCLMVMYCVGLCLFSWWRYKRHSFVHFIRYMWIFSLHEDFMITSHIGWSSNRVWTGNGVDWIPYYLLVIEMCYLLYNNIEEGPPNCWEKKGKWMKINLGHLKEIITKRLLCKNKLKTVFFY